MARLHTWIAVSLISFSAVGCVSTEQYKAVQMDRDRLAEQLAHSEQSKAEALASSQAYKSQLDNIALGANAKDALIVNQSNQINELQRQYDELNRKYGDSINRTASAAALPGPLNDALTAFAAQYPELVDFDSARGTVKFKSDVTFAPGSAILTSQAQTVIDRFAGILNSAAAASYELMVVGHTDNTRVSHEATRAAGHKDNWYLSAHRAISVSEQLQQKGVSPSRLEVAGFADQRPIASNTSEAGKAQNRRVEVLILPSTIHSNVAAAPAAPTRTVRNKPAFNKDNKDVVDTTDQRKPAFNK
jgi:chemotaxis protein MotB